MAIDERRAQIHERHVFRRMAHWGASRGPEWWVRAAPLPFAWAAAALVPSARRAALRNLRRIRGPGSTLRDARDVLATFSSYACCLAEVLSNDAARGPRVPRATILGERFFHDAISAGRGVVLVTAHTAGWESAGPLLARDYALRIMLVMEAEADARARELSDRARERAGVAIAHVGDPLASLPLLRHLRSGGVVALQLDRAPAGMRTRAVRVLDEPGVVPEGPFQLAQLSGAPVLPVFCAREGFRRYVVQAFEPRTLPRRASEAERDEAAQHVASCMSRFLRAHPTQWFNWQS